MFEYTPNIGRRSMTTLRRRSSFVDHHTYRIAAKRSTSDGLHQDLVFEGRSRTAARHSTQRSVNVTLFRNRGVALTTLGGVSLTPYSNEHPDRLPARLSSNHAESFTVQTMSGEMTFSAAELEDLRGALQSMLLEYSSALREIETKLGVLRDEFKQLHDYNPIEHISTRVKTIDSLVSKAARKGVDFDLGLIRRKITDIAGARVSCSFVTDVYRLFNLLSQQDDIKILQVKDYIAHPKPNGYKSLHAIISTPIYLSSGRRDVTLEVQFRTIAMDFWASLEHKIHYKYDGAVPSDTLAELKDAADTAAELDQRMERLHREINGGPDTLTA